MNQLTPVGARSLLKHVIWDCLAAINEYTSDLNEDTFAGNRLVRDAVIRNLDLLNRSVHKIPQDFRNRYPEVAWERLDTLKHDLVLSETYGIRYPPQSWRTIREEVPVIQEQVRRVIEEV